MRITIIPPDEVVWIGGTCVFNIDMSKLNKNIKAVQWDGKKGWIEYTDEHKPNKKITTLSGFGSVIEKAKAIISTPEEIEKNTFEQVRTEKLSEAKSLMYQTINNSGVSYQLDKKWYNFGCDQNTLNGLMRELSLFETGINTKNYTNWYPKGATMHVSLSLEDLKNILKLIVNKHEAITKKYFVHKERILKCSSIEEIMKYNIRIGWN